jgi:hypothetical protein
VAPASLALGDNVRTLRHSCMMLYSVLRTAPRSFVPLRNAHSSGLHRS